MPYNIIINSNCNQDCSYCFAKDVIDSDEEISLDSVHFVKDFFQKSNRNNISLIGGEPTLHKSFIQIIEIFRQSNFNISIKTNALFSQKISDFFSEHSTGIHFLINVNEPSIYPANIWKKLYKNLKSLNNEFIILGFNICSPQFQYKHVLELARDLNIHYIRWSFAHPIFNNNNVNKVQNYLPIFQYKDTIQCLLNFIVEANSLKIETLGDHSIPLCVFEKQELDLIYQNNGEINSMCEGTIDISQNLGLLYCLPMKNLFHGLSLTDFSTLDEIELFFESRISELRYINLPFQDCITCEYLIENKCHGGCMSHRKFTENEIERINQNWTTKYLKNKIVYIPEYIDFKEKDNQIIAINRKNDYELELNNNSYEKLQMFNRNTEFGNIIDMNDNFCQIDNGNYDESVANFMEVCRLFGILKIKNNGL